MGYWDNFSNNIVQMANTLLPVAQKTAPKVLAGDPTVLTALGKEETYKPSVSKTMVSPVYEKDNDVLETDIAENRKPSANEILALMRSTNSVPQWSREVVTTTPYARDDMLARRAQLGENNEVLNKILGLRETIGYSLANSLANIPKQQGYGTWLTDFARAFGGGLKSPVDAEIDREKYMTDLALKNINAALNLDKEMGGIKVTETSGSPKENYMDMLGMQLLNGGYTNE